MCKSVVSVTVLISHLGHRGLEGLSTDVIQLCFLGFTVQLGGNFYVVIIVNHFFKLVFNIMSTSCLWFACNCKPEHGGELSSCGFLKKMYIVFSGSLKGVLKDFFFHKCNPSCPRISKSFSPLTRLPRAHVTVWRLVLEYTKTEGQKISLQFHQSTFVRIRSEKRHYQ